MPFPLPAGDVLWLTIARVHTPDGRMIQRSYHGLPAARYAAAAEALRRGGIDAAPAGSGGIEPDHWFDARVSPPAWWSAMLGADLDLAAVHRADLPTGDDPALWAGPLMDALRTVLIEHSGSAAPIAPEQERGVSRHLARVAMRVRIGEAPAAEFAVRTDPEVMRALILLDELAVTR
jgi:hypothetical protein